MRLSKTFPLLPTPNVSSEYSLSDVVAANQNSLVVTSAYRTPAQQKALGLKRTPSRHIQPKHIFLDEAGYYFQQNDDRLKDEVKRIPTVPPYAYEVDGHGVFVFNKLLTDLKKRHATEVSGSAFETLVRQCLPNAYVSPFEAVSHWNVMPMHYHVEPYKEGFVIVHTVFKVRLAEVFTTRKALDHVLAILLVGGIYSCEGNLTYQGQTFVNHRYTPTSTDIPRMLCHGETQYQAADTKRLKLSPNAFTPGFSGLSHKMYQDDSDEESKWFHRCAYQRAWVKKQRQEGTFPSIDLSSINLSSTKKVIPSYTKQLRKAYPELSTLNDQTLIELYETYATPGCMGHPNFLYRVMGLLSGQSIDTFDNDTSGIHLIYARGHGLTLEQAIEYAKTSSAYAYSLAARTHYAENVMARIKKDKNLNPYQGPEVISSMDWLRSSRKNNAAPMLVTQNLADFTGT